MAVKVTSAPPFESTLAEDTLKECFTTKNKVKRLTGDKANDSDGLDKKLKKKGVELNAPHKKNRKKTQDEHENSEVTATDGRQNASLPGYKTFAGAW